MDRNSGAESLALSHGSGGSDSGVSDQPIIGTGTEEFGYGTSRGEGGELLEWFTVVAEYQYRRQLAKLHNSICCVAGNLDDVIHDPTLGRFGSHQFYNAFGIYHFDQGHHEDGNVSPVGYSTTPLSSFLEGLPWRLDKESKILETDPEWLAIARQRAANSALEVSTPVLEQSSQEDSRRTSNSAPVAGPVRKIARWIRIANRLPTIVDSEDEAPSPSRKEGEVDDEKPRTQTGNEKLDRDDDRQLNEENLLPASVRRMNRSQSVDSAGDESFMTATEYARSEMLSSDDDSFRTALRSSVTASGSESFNTAIGASGISEMTRLKRVSFSDSSTSFTDNHPSTDPDSPLPFVTPRKQSMPTRGISEQTEVHSNKSLEASEGLDVQRKVGPSDNRLARMENIMEQLLVFSSEQALQNMNTRLAAPTTLGNNQSLVQQISSLQSELERQNAAEQRAHQEIEVLREQVSKLTEMVTNIRSPIPEARSDIVSARPPEMGRNQGGATSPEPDVGEELSDDLEDLNGSWMKAGEN